MNEQIESIINRMHFAADELANHACAITDECRLLVEDEAPLTSDEIADAESITNELEHLEE